jgi:pSer/pThr/pTyr-binding forkhead associated (FHA) protein
MNEPLYIQLTWEDPETGILQEPILNAPVAIGRETEQMPECLGENPVSRLQLNHKQISRFHCLITVANYQMYITDKSANGTFLNGQMVAKGSQPFTSKDTIRIGPYKITATLIREDDFNATEITRESIEKNNLKRSLSHNPLILWLGGGLVLLMMSLGTWLLVSTVLNNSRPQIPDQPTENSSTIELNN